MEDLSASVRLSCCVADVVDSIATSRHKVHDYEVSLSGVCSEIGGRMRLQVALVGLILVLSIERTIAQMPTPAQQGLNVPGMSQEPRKPEDDPLRAQQEQKLAKIRNEERQKKLVSDTDELLTLTADLKRQIDKTTPGTLSIDLIKKAGEIEKLAHSVKERLKG
jgi:hypothetical protein